MSTRMRFMLGCLAMLFGIVGVMSIGYGPHADGTGLGLSVLGLVVAVGLWADACFPEGKP